MSERDNLPPVIPHRRIPAHPGVVSFEDRDNFVRNLATVLVGGAAAIIPTATHSSGAARAAPLTRAATGDPVLTLAQIKAHLRIEADATDEDAYLEGLEKAARLHVSNHLRRELDAGVGENVKQAMLLVIAHWYRNRESVAAGGYAELPLAFYALLSPERDFAYAFGYGDYTEPPVVIVGPPGPPGPPGEDAARGYAEIPDSSIMGTLPLWPETLVFVDSTIEVPAGDHVLEIRIMLSIDSSNKDDVVTMRCNGLQQSLNLGDMAGPDNVLSGMFAFALIPDPAGGAIPLRIEAGANRAGVVFYGADGPRPEWISYATWLIAPLAE